ncbi:MAG: nucleotidyl transferase AbiEii/AbiGii toxin family protein [Bacteroidales bacterium]|jgi:predicted nucleotidyltransferase component of viral defense system|nr:nucleotidyl transferase AbiEii/AbiGii toxin family protein [Bacteroidales bacterium]MCI2122332.1 nucleotidyl transferase AbiEii/AbiGii toxin family protein [Bacteroidales bacterium]MCI2145741.1 nucleotidyl transferase AbiEii/AbiGii toxin family protein [Bacteroidales bacterium]
MNGIYQNMLSAYDMSTEQARRNAVFEVNQQIILSGLCRGGFFDTAAFYGGTCLRIFHGLDRFSEDMDFSLLSPDDGYEFERFFPAVVNEFALVGREVEIRKKEKNNSCNVESAFLKGDTDMYDVTLKAGKSIKIKIEIDTRPPLKFATEEKLLLQPTSFMTKCFTLPCLFAGKMHALVFRNWKNRVKGRDWYDFEWYVKSGVQLDFAHLQERIRKFNGKDMSKAEFMQLLRERLATTDMKSVKRDVEPFLRNKEGLDIWSNDYFLQLADRIRFR